MIQRKLAIWSVVPLPFLKPAWTSASSRFMYCWSLAWRILSITLLVCEMSAIMWQFEHSLALPFWDWNENWPFQSCGHCWVFQICWHIECSTFTASSFRIWNSSTGIPSPPLALFIVMLSNCHLNACFCSMAFQAHSTTPAKSWKKEVISYSGHSKLNSVNVTRESSYFRGFIVKDGTLIMPVPSQGFTFQSHG